MDLVCRTCLKIIEYKAAYSNLNELSDARIREKLEACVPELTLDIVVEPVICDACEEHLAIAFLFKTQCLETEKTLFNYIQRRIQTQNCTDLLNNKDLVELTKINVILEHNYSTIEQQCKAHDELSTNIQTLIKSTLSSFVQPTAVRHEQMIPYSFNDEPDCKVVDHVVNFETVECCESDFENMPNDTTASRGSTPSPIPKPLKPLPKLIPKPISTLIEDKPLPMLIPKPRPKRTSVKKHKKKKGFPKVKRLVHVVATKKTQDRRKNPRPRKYVQFNGEHFMADLVEDNKENVDNEKKKTPAVRTKAEMKERPAEKRRPVAKKKVQKRGRSHGKMRLKKNLSYLCENGYKCTKCKKSFRYRCHLKMHMKAHTMKKMYKCSVCERPFAQERHMKAHELTHTRLKFDCKLCNKSLSSQTSLRRHCRLHTGECSFTCEVCKKEFAQKTQLEVHQRTHNGDNPFTCVMCNMSFAYKNHLVTHLQIHTGERPYQCEKCHKRFNKSNVFRIHMQIHEDKPYQCNGCTKFFKEQASYRKHVGKYLPKCVAGRKVFKEECSKLEAKSKVLEEIDNDLKEINKDIAAEDEAKTIKLKKMQYLCKVCNKGFTTNFSRNRHLKFQHAPK